MRLYSNPLAEAARKVYFDFAAEKQSTYHVLPLGRLIEMLHCAEEMKVLLHDPMLLGNDLERKG